MKYNKSPISLREGKMFIDGVEVMDGIKANIKFTPDVWTGKQLGEQTPSSRYLGYAITGSITRRRSTTTYPSAIRRLVTWEINPQLKPVFSCSSRREIGP